MVSFSVLVRPSSPTMTVLLFLPKGGLASTTSIALAGVGGQRVAHHHGHRFSRANAVQHHVHGAHAGRGLHQLIAGESLFLQGGLSWSRVRFCCGW